MAVANCSRRDAPGQFAPPEAAPPPGQRSGGFCQLVRAVRRRATFYGFLATTDLKLIGVQHSSPSGVDRQQNVSPLIVLSTDPGGHAGSQQKSRASVAASGSQQ